MKKNMKILAVLLFFLSSFSLYGQMENMWVCGTDFEVDTSGGGGQPSRPPGTIPMMDDFSSSTIDMNKWLMGTNSGNLSSIINGELNLKSSGSGQAGWVVTDKSYAPRNSTVTIKVSQANDDGNIAISPTYDLSSPTGIYNQNNYYQFYTYRSGGTGSYQLYSSQPGSG